MAQQLSQPGQASIVVPDGWEPFYRPSPQVDLVVLEPLDESLVFRANLVVTTAPQDGISFRDWQNRTDETFPSVLDDYQLIDLEMVTFAGAPGGRRLAHYRSADGIALVMEQWFAIIDEVGYTLTATIDTPRYSVNAELFADVASRFELLAESKVTP